MLFVLSTDFFFKIVFFFFFFKKLNSFKDTIRFTNTMTYSLHAGLFFKHLLSLAEFIKN